MAAKYVHRSATSLVSDNICTRIIGGIPQPRTHPIHQVCFISDQNNVFVSGRWNSCLVTANIGTIICMVYSVALNQVVYEALFVSFAKIHPSSI